MCFGVFILKGYHEAMVVSMADIAMEEIQVFQSIVEAVTIDVMDDLTFAKRPAKMLCHDGSMGFHLFAVDPHPFIFGFWFSSRP